MITQKIGAERTGTLGLLTYRISREMFCRQADYILRSAYEQGYQVVMSIAAHRKPLAPLDHQTMQIKELISRGLDGLLINTRGDGEEAERIVDTVRGRVPVVVFHHPTPNLSGVVLDETSGYYEATEHLIRLGHERIGFIGTDWRTRYVGSAKAKGYFLAMRKHGLTPQRISGKTALLEPAYQLGKRLGDRFTALVCRSDYTAIGVCRGLREAGIRVPEDVAVVGSGDIEVGSCVTSALTTMATPYEVIAQAVMELMLEQLGGGHEPRQITLKSPLIVRESCGANISKNDRKGAHCPE